MYKQASLMPFVLRVVQEKGTEAPFSDQRHATSGRYLCRLCGLALFKASHQFVSGCGWPSFDAALFERVRYVPDLDGIRTEIVCARCQAHLGHVFHGEGWTSNNTRYCVNGVSLDWVPDEAVDDSAEAIVAGGCFWGVQYWLDQCPGVLATEVGYTGGAGQDPSYSDVCAGGSGHVEAVRVLFDPQKIAYDALIRYFLEIHDPSQADGQGPDIGPQYHSVIFYYDTAQKTLAQHGLDQLQAKGMKIATRLRPVGIFWTAEAYHQHYYDKLQQQPYCHVYTKRF